MYIFCRQKYTKNHKTYTKRTISTLQYLIKILKIQSKLQLIYSFRLIIDFLFNIYIIQITSTSSVSELSTNWANSWSSTSRFTAWLRCRCDGYRFRWIINVGSINAIMPYLPIIRANLMVTSSSFPSRRILVVRGQPACFCQIGGLTTRDLMDSGTSHSSGWQTG